ncbi:hypothetical protein EZV62_009340 [Acer yangbiense]|uniref:NB-ARC domain-containing protein n=1 Tax=Acer yangbiense TaxID=1000413 RepID=A0A5C7IGA1_9ROSI|nr:hypothetical protein EZV62_009340 [Acer yangbiense]
MKRTNMVAKQVISIQSSVSLGFVSQLGSTRPLHLPLSLKKLDIRNCKILQHLLDDASTSSPSSPVIHIENINTAKTSRLEDLFTSNCLSLTSLSSTTNGQLPETLKVLQIHYCPKLTTLSSQGQLPKLDRLVVQYCSELTILSPEGQLPETLEYLHIESCPELLSIADRFQTMTSLKVILIEECEKLKSIPEGLHNLSCLQCFALSHCPNVVSFPQGGLPNTKLKGFPTSLTCLKIEDDNIYKRLVEWGLHNLTSLRQLEITGCPDEEFPQRGMDIMLPSSLTQLKIENFENLKCLLGQSFQNLTSLQHLTSLIVQISHPF